MMEEKIEELKRRIFETPLGKREVLLRQLMELADSSEGNVAREVYEFIMYRYLWHSEIVREALVKRRKLIDREERWLSDATTFKLGLSKIPYYTHPSINGDRLVGLMSKLAETPDQVFLLLRDAAQVGDSGLLVKVLLSLGYERMKAVSSILPVFVSEEIVDVPIKGLKVEEKRKVWRIKTIFEP